MDFIQQMVQQDFLNKGIQAITTDFEFVKEKMSKRAVFAGKTNDEVKAIMVDSVKADPLGFLVVLTKWKSEQKAGEIKLPVSEVIDATVSDDFELPAPACYLRPGDAGFEECEACQ